MHRRHLRLLVTTLLLCASAGLAHADCTASDTTLCLNDGRFSASVAWKDFQGRTGEGHAESDGWVSRLSAKGDLVWRNTFAGEGFQVVYHVRERRDGSFLATGYGFVNPESDHDAFIVRLGTDGKVLTRCELGGSAYDRATQSVELNDGSTITVGYTKRANAPDDAPAWQTTLYGVDAKGRRTWTRSIGGEGYESGRWIARRGQDVWVVSQSTPPSGGSRVLVARLELPPTSR